MMVATIATSLRLGWLPVDARTPQYHRALRLAWEGLASRVLPNGTVLGICEGTGIMDNVAEYNARSTDYKQSPPGGAGAVLRAAVAMAEYEGWLAASPAQAARV